MGSILWLGHLSGQDIDMSLKKFTMGCKWQTNYVAGMKPFPFELLSITFTGQMEDKTN